MHRKQCGSPEQGHVQARLLTGEPCHFAEERLLHHGHGPCSSGVLEQKEGTEGELSARFGSRLRRVQAVWQSVSAVRRIGRRGKSRAGRAHEDSHALSRLQQVQKPGNEMMLGPEVVERDSGQHSSLVRRGSRKSDINEVKEEYHRPFHTNLLTGEQVFGLFPRCCQCGGMPPRCEIARGSSFSVTGKSDRFSEWLPSYGGDDSRAFLTAVRGVLPGIPRRCKVGRQKGG